MDSKFFDYSPAFQSMNGHLEPIVVSVSAPAKTPHGDYVCVVVVRWNNRPPEDAKIIGYDPLQAIGLAVNFAHQRILDSPEREAGEIVNEDSDEVLELPRFCFT